MPQPSPQPVPAFTALLHLQEVTRSVRVEPVLSEGAPRSFAAWKWHERQLLAALKAHGVDDASIGQVLQRTTQAVAKKTQAVAAGWVRPVPLTDLPLSPLDLSPADLDLLATWDGVPGRDPLGWHYGAAVTPDLLALSKDRVLRVVEVEVDPALALGQGTKPETSTAYADMVARGVWNNLAAILVQQDGQVLLPMHDPHHRQQLAVREAVKRTAHLSVPKKTVLSFPFEDERQTLATIVLIDRPELWLRTFSDALHSQVVVLVVPAIARLPDHESPAIPLHLSQQIDLPAVLPRGDKSRAAREARQFRQRLIDLWSYDRRVEYHRQTGIPNTSGIPARLDWTALQWVPASGRVVAQRDELLVRAAAWYALTQRRRPQLPPDLQHSLDQLISPDLALQPAAIRRKCDDAYELRQMSRWHARAVLTRLWADVLMVPDLQSAGLPFETATHDVMAYIGR